MKDVKLSLFMDNLIVYIENTKDLQTIRINSEFSRVAPYKVH